jgi:hypothetical protein
MKRLLKKWLKRRVYDIYPCISGCPGVFEYIYNKPLHKWNIYLLILRNDGGRFQDIEEVEQTYEWLNNS